MFEGIQRGLADALKKLRGRGRLTAATWKKDLRDVRTALLEADAISPSPTTSLAASRKIDRPGSLRKSIRASRCPQSFTKSWSD